MDYVWEFIDSPAPVDWDSKSMQARLVTTYFPDCANLAWAHRIDRDDPSKATVSSGQSEVAGTGGNQVYCDWEEPLKSLLEHIRTKGPYDGILGFSQGANMAGLLSAISESDVMPWLRFRFAVLICSSRYSWCDEFLTVDPLRTTLPVHLFQGGSEGDVPLIAAGSSGAEPTLSMPSLHIISTMDPLRGASESMAELFSDARCESFANTHKPPNQKVHAPSTRSILYPSTTQHHATPLTTLFALRATLSPELTLLRHGTTDNQGGRCCARRLRCPRGRSY
mmetsp:Transcript_110143/g.320760  ORF Transcript_110143/g.320760 Transcript_110143/m.320760 type:complete len:280 (+) Transcript_110143:133-972(+)